MYFVSFIDMSFTNLVVLHSFILAVVFFVVHCMLCYKAPVKTLICTTGSCLNTFPLLHEIVVYIYIYMPDCMYCKTYIFGHPKFH